MPKRSTVRITEKTVKTKPSTKPFEIRDCDLRGFILRIEPTGTRTFYAEWGKGQRTRIGDAALMNVTEARDEAEQRIANAKRGEIPKPQIRNRMPTLNKFIDERYRGYAEANQKAGPANVQRVLSAFSCLGGKKLDRITNWDMEQWKADRKKAGTKPATINRDLTMLRAALNRAVEWGVLKINPLQGVKALRGADEKRVRYLSDSEEKRLLEALEAREAKLRAQRRNGNRWRRKRNRKTLPAIREDQFADHLLPMVIISRNTGMRFKELSQLRWEHVRLTREVPVVRVQASSAKTGRARDIPLNTEAVATLERWRAQGEDASGYVFPNPDGSRIKKLRTSWNGVLEKAKIKDFRWHDLRHDFASRLVMNGAPLNTVRELLGHASLEMTIRYAHLAPSHLAEAVALLGAPASQSAPGTEEKTA